MITEINPDTGEDLEKLIYSGKLDMKVANSRYKGYVSRKSDGFGIDYSGKYGHGIRFFEPAFDSAQYCYVSYYVEK